ncbi:hypothetical protein POX_c04053 [Penicillium oxalicum]|uniref:hypothetical protein n=1 Tax=Penicillium oxalicum TaxID=69781 RepID=UPI0020B71BAC|nr:hypothetical protein POX_c04053 [Penicillium oxalicum]KAI2791197.1 hypothetical protein POX_c04053 [Penicillium oxalicum]
MKNSFLLGTSGLLAATVGGSAEPRSTPGGSLFLRSIAESVALPTMTWSANGTHTAKGYTSQAADETSLQGMKADCGNINLNKKISVDFRSDVFGPGLIGYFYKCEKIREDTNLYWFTISSGNSSQIDQLCDPATTFPLVFDSQHSTWWIDEPFDCTQRTSPDGQAGLEDF